VSRSDGPATLLVTISILTPGDAASPSGASANTSDDINEAAYRAVPGLLAATTAVVGPGAVERDRDRYPWRRLHGRLAESLRGEIGMTDDDFAWPHKTDEQTAAYEQSMSVGLGPVTETFHHHAHRLWPGRRRFLDVGGGDGTLAAQVLNHAPDLMVDVYNLPAVASLVEQTRSRCGHPERLSFVAGDFLTEPLPSGYDALAFVRVLHDWPTAISRRLVETAYQALPPSGLLLICEEFRTPDRLAMQFFWSYVLIGVDSCVSRLRDVDFYTSLLEEVGFETLGCYPAAGSWSSHTNRRTASSIDTRTRSARCWAIWPRGAARGPALPGGRAPSW
jgi:demethylspheroidene O-methyltransferase